MGARQRVRSFLVCSAAPKWRHVALPDIAPQRLGACARLITCESSQSDDCCFAAGSAVVRSEVGVVTTRILVCTFTRRPAHIEHGTSVQISLAWPQTCISPARLRFVSFAGCAVAKQSAVIAFFAALSDSLPAPPQSWPSQIPSHAIGPI